MIAEPDAIVRFWFEELSPKEWYGAPARVDAEITARFGDTYAALEGGVPPDWLEGPKGFLAAILVLD